MKTMPNATSISVIIPNHNGGATIGECLRAAFNSNYRDFEVIVVDDASTDDSREIIKKYPCRLVQLESRGGVSKARNIGANYSRGEVLLFIDADCLLQKDTIALVNKTMQEDSIKVVGGTYTKIPYDSDNFFSVFQSNYVNYCETKSEEPNYLATHCLAIDAQLFREFNGFVEGSFIGVTPGVEDVELSHRLRRAGHKLIMNPSILVQHVYNFSFLKSLSNAVKRSMYWTMYSIRNKDLFRDTGCAGIELKINVACHFLNTIQVLLYFLYSNLAFLALIPAVFALNIFVNRRLIAAFYDTKGTSFFLAAISYYTLIYPPAVGIGSLTGALKYLWEIKLLGRYK